jgi:4-amino-4-deoxy-L-arabinose transferase-like glycosyltransferase
MNFRAISRYDWALIMLIILVLVAHIALLGEPHNAYVFDEAHYVPGAKCLLNGTVCKVEHPPLAMASIAAGITLFGDNGIGWRLFTVIAGTLSLAVVYLIVKKFANSRVALLAAFLLGIENLWFIHSSIAMLDIIAIFFVLLSTYLFLAEQYIWSGAFIGFGMLAKEVMVLALPVLALYVALSQPRLFSRDSFVRIAKIMAAVGIPAAAVFLVGLGFYDAAYEAFPSPIHHVKRIIMHNQAFEAPRMSDTVHPLRWFSGFPASPYFVTSVSVANSSMKRMILQYLGQANLIILLFIWLAIPLVWKQIREREPLALLNALMIAVPYAFFIYMAFERVTYPFYMLVFIPSLCIISALALDKLPRNVVIAYCVGALIWFLYWFPKNLLVIGA